MTFTLATRVSGLVVVGFVTWASACGAEPDSSTEDWLAYEPAVVELRGTLTEVTKLGPPNYGEDPETDERLEIPVLQLSKSINVKGDPYDQTNNATFTGVGEVQLIFLSADEQYRDLTGREVVVEGTLSEAMTGHHFTKVVMTVKAIREDHQR